jgi:very-short-patch-repair endonuclease
MPRTPRGPATARSVRLLGSGTSVQTGEISRLEGRTAIFGAGVASELEALLLNRLERAGLPVPVGQFRFCPTRRWRADFAYPASMLLIEADGGTWSGGRHVRGSGFEADCEKTSAAAALGYRVIRVTRKMIQSGLAVELIAQALGITPASGRDVGGS